MITMPAGYPYRRKSWVKRLRGHNYVETVPQELLQWVPDTHIKLRDALELLGSTELSDWTSNESEALWYTQSPDRPWCWSENADDLPELFILSENGEIVQTDEDGADSWWQVIEPILIAEWPLLPADLLRNYIFLRAARTDPSSTETLYKKYWARFDEDFWRVEVKQGRLTRPRSDLYMQHFLSSRQGHDIPIKHLYVEYRHWVEREKPFANVQDELATLARQGDDFRRLLEPAEDDVISLLMQFLEAFDIRTIYPLLLAMLDSGLEDGDLLKAGKILESYLLRRAVCDLTTKNYNKIFLSMTRLLRQSGFSPVELAQHLLRLGGESAEWPTDAQFKDAWLKKPQYEILNNPKLVNLLSRLNEQFGSSKSEALKFTVQPTIEHILPQKWVEHWPLPDGTKGLDFLEQFAASDNDLTAKASAARDRMLHTIGNLTILSSALNNEQSNRAWKNKRPDLMSHSLLPINLMLGQLEVWDEAAIQKRGELLFEKALEVWPRVPAKT